VKKLWERLLKTQLGRDMRDWYRDFRKKRSERAGKAMSRAYYHAAKRH
jgi:hypothetical protein